MLFRNGLIASCRLVRGFVECDPLCQVGRAAHPILVEPIPGCLNLGQRIIWPVCMAKCSTT